MAARNEIFDVHAEEGAPSLWADADARAREEVVAWLVPQLADAYRGAVRRWLVGQTGMAGATDEVPSAQAGKGTYVYGIAESGRAEELVGVPGIDGSAVTMIVEGPLMALTSTVRLDGFHAAQESPDLSEHSWLATTIRAHEGVVEDVCGRTTVLPMRFGTVYPSSTEVSAFLVEHAQALTDELARLRGCSEWGAKLHIDRGAAFRGARAQEPALDATEEEVNAASEGTAWMLRRRLAARTFHTVTKQVQSCADSVHAGLASCALDTVVSRRGNGDDPEGLVLNASYLVDDPDSLHRCAEQLRARFDDDGVQLQITGPWPAYHFVRLPELGSRHG